MFDKASIDPVRHGGAGLRTFINIVALWHLTDKDQMRILGIRDRADFENWKANVQAHRPIAIPMDVIVRIGCVLSIYASLRTLFPSDSSIAEWPHRPISGTVFSGKTPLSLMTRGELGDLDKVVQYLLGLIHGQ